MPTRALALFALLLLLALAAPLPAADPLPLFDGKTLAGWEGNLDWFRLEEGAVVAGSLEQRIPRNEFLCTDREYGDFELRLEVKVTPPALNAGIQFRSARIPDHHEVIGYQADVGGKWWGKLYDESRRRKVLTPIDEEPLARILKPGDWNEYVIRAEGPRIRLSINGHQTVDYKEADADIPRSGIIGLQIHGGPPGEARYRHLTIQELNNGDESKDKRSPRSPD